jgi:hypothetical protein
MLLECSACCTSIWRIGGSVITGWGNCPMPDLPLGTLLRELELHCDFALRYIERNKQ